MSCLSTRVIGKLVALCWMTVVRMEAIRFETVDRYYCSSQKYSDCAASGTAQLVALRGVVLANSTGRVSHIGSGGLATLLYDSEHPCDETVSGDNP